MKRPWSGWRSAEDGQLTLIGLLLVIVIIGILFAIMYGGGGGGGTSPGGGGSPTTTLGGAKRRAQDAVCRNNLSQLRSAISIYQSNGGGNPPSLESLQLQLPLVCPVGGEPYQYDPNSGRASCVHPGHETY
jgi:type II secretory pathway pseudopilin PulG